MKTPQIILDAQANWPEDEAGLTADAFTSRAENGYTTEENEVRLSKDVAHMRKVFGFESDADELTARYFAALAKLR